MSNLADWTKPIQFQNGQPCRLLETKSGGQRVVHREGVTDITAIWEMAPDGQMLPGSIGERMGYSIVNPAPAGPPVTPE